MAPQRVTTRDSVVSYVKGVQNTNGSCCSKNVKQSLHQELRRLMGMESVYKEKLLERVENGGDRDGDNDQFYLVALKSWRVPS
jgi:DNA-binding protein Fis